MDSSPLRYSAEQQRADSLSLTAALPLSTTEDPLCISPRCAGPDLLYGYLSAPNLGSPNYFPSTLTACIFIYNITERAKVRRSWIGLFYFYSLITYNHERWSISEIAVAPAEINLSPMFNAQLVSHPDKSIARCPWRELYSAQICLPLIIFERPHLHH